MKYNAYEVAGLFFKEVVLALSYFTNLPLEKTDIFWHFVNYNLGTEPFLAVATHSMGKREYHLSSGVSKEEIFTYYDTQFDGEFLLFREKQLDSVTFTSCKSGSELRASRIDDDPPEWTLRLTLPVADAQEYRGAYFTSFAKATFTAVHGRRNTNV